MNGSPNDLAVSNTSAPKAFKPRPSTPAVGRYFLLRTIYTVAITRVSTMESWAFVIRPLRYIGDNTGIMHGHGLINLLGRGVDGMHNEDMKALHGLDGLGKLSKMNGRRESGGGIRVERMRDRDVKLGRTLEF